ncbi:MAG: DUF2911 domain-containing protein [Acidobacteriota bacterium]|nr:DUF2911 domain-containing protein [Acidobacteriota bacterium]
MLLPAVKADTWNHKTKLTFSEPVEVPGKVLPAGTYTFKLMDSQADRHIVEIYNADETQLMDTVLAVPDKRMHVTGKTVVKFAERPSGSPEAIKAWFYPGAVFGERFVYPHDKATELAKANKEPVFSTRSDLSSNATKPINSDQDESAMEMRKAPVKAVNPAGEEIEIIEVYRLPSAKQ